MGWRLKGLHDRYPTQLHEENIFYETEEFALAIQYRLIRTLYYRQDINKGQPYL